MIFIIACKTEICSNFLKLTGHAAYDIIDLLEKVRTGDKLAFGELFHRYRDRVFSVAYTYLQDTHAAEDIVQDVFISVWKNRDELSGIANIKAWLYTITRNYSLNALQQMARTGKNKQQLLSHLPVQALDGEEKMDVSHLQTLLQQAMTLLTPQQRKVFELSRIQGYSREEIARALGITVITVSSHLTLSLRTIRAFLSSRIGLVSLFLLGKSLCFCADGFESLRLA